MSPSRRRQQLLDQFLAGQIDRETYDRFLDELQESSSGSVVSASLIVERSSESPEVTIASSAPESQHAALKRPVALVGAGMELGGFRIEKSLGRGGMGEVWRARDLVGDRTVVIKLLHPEFVNHPEELASVKETFLRVHRLQHQNICPVYLLGQDSRFGYYVVMKFIDGLTLSCIAVSIWKPIRGSH
jgi:serine/threonine protein kinase